jgi:hypothetical protein
VDCLFSFLGAGCNLRRMDEELDIPDVNGICRLCLNDDCTIIPIFGRENTSRNGIPLSKKILDCVSVKVSTDSVLILGIKRQGGILK